MTTRRIFFRPLIPLLGATCLISPFYFKLERLPSSTLPVKDAPPRRLDIAVDSSDELVTAKLSVVSKGDVSPIAAADHEKIMSILDDARTLMNKARGLIRDESSAAKEVVDAATLKFREAKDQILKQRMNMVVTAEESDAGDEEYEVKENHVRRETIEEIATEEDRDLDLSRSVYETVSWLCSTYMHLLLNYTLRRVLTLAHDTLILSSVISTITFILTSTSHSPNALISYLKIAWIL